MAFDNESLDRLHRARRMLREAHMVIEDMLTPGHSGYVVHDLNHVEALSRGANTILKEEVSKVSP